MQFRVNTPNVVHETLDGEVIVVNVHTGTYYSLLGSGAAVWAAVERGLSEEDTAGQFVARDGSNRESVTTEVRRFLGELEDEALIVPAESGAPPSVASELPLFDSRGSFTPPVLEKYSDMQDLLLLDPIHEVDATGWPKKK